MSLAEFEVISKLGEGQFSNVYKVKRVEDSQVYALKKVQLIPMPTKEIQNAVNQVRILASIRHPNVIGYKQAFFDSETKSLCIVMEYADGGDLAQKINEHKNKGQYFKEAQIWDYFSQMASGLGRLHELGILHRDVKSANFFITRNGVIKIGDMNVSKIVRKEGMCETQTGAPLYSSPEVWRSEAYDSKSDVWSLGCVLYELINLKMPFRGRDMEGLFKKVSRGYYSRINKSYSQDLSNVLKLLIQADPKQRTSLRDLMELPLWKNNVRKRFEFVEKSSLIKTIKLTKNISFIGKSLPKENYSPLKFKHQSMSRSLVDKSEKAQSETDLSKERRKLSKSKRLSPTVKLSLPPLPNNSALIASSVSGNKSGRYGERQVSSEKSKPGYKRARSYRQH